MNDFYEQKANKYKYKYLKLKEYSGGAGIAPDSASGGVGDVLPGIMLFDVYHSKMVSCLRNKDPGIIIPSVYYDSKNDRANFQQNPLQNGSLYLSNSGSQSGSKLAEQSLTASAITQTPSGTPLGIAIASQLQAATRIQSPSRTPTRTQAPTVTALGIAGVQSPAPSLKKQVSSQSLMTSGNKPREYISLTPPRTPSEIPTKEEIEKILSESSFTFPDSINQENARPLYEIVTNTKPEQKSVYGTVDAEPTVSSQRKVSSQPTVISNLKKVQTNTRSLPPPKGVFSLSKTEQPFVQSLSLPPQSSQQSQQSTSPIPPPRLSLQTESPTAPPRAPPTQVPPRAQQSTSLTPIPQKDRAPMTITESLTILNRNNRSQISQTVAQPHSQTARNVGSVVYSKSNIGSTVVQPLLSQSSQPLLSQSSHLPIAYISPPVSPYSSGTRNTLDLQTKERIKSNSPLLQSEVGNT